MQILYFWEGNHRPGYIDLCIETWRNVKGVSVQKVDYSNLAEMTDGVLSVRRISRYPLPVQSDLIAAVVLAQRGGIFIDADTIIFDRFQLSRYPTDVCTFYGPIGGSVSLAFVLASGGGDFASEWASRTLTALEEPGKLRRLYWDVRKQITGKPAKVPWNWLGNAILDDLIRIRQPHGAVHVRDLISTGMYPYPSLTGQTYGAEQYQQIMFSDVDRSEVIVGGALEGILALQNSWHPPEFQAMTATEVLESSTTLSRILAAALGSVKEAVR